MIQTITLIPARLAATRFPNKPLVEILGKPMIVHVMERAMEADIGPVIVACGDREIADAIQTFGGTAVMTDPDLPSGTDRIAAALDIFDPDQKYVNVINLQGDLPNLPPVYLTLLDELLQQHAYDMVTLVAPTQSKEEENSPNVVKAVISCAPHENIGRALYFSRLPLRSANNVMYHHIGLYGFKRNQLNTFISLPSSPLERQERLEQLRALEHGMTIGVGIVDHPPHGVDAPEDLEKVRTMMMQNPHRSTP